MNTLEKMEADSEREALDSLGLSEALQSVTYEVMDAQGESVVNVYRSGNAYASKAAIHARSTRNLSPIGSFPSWGDALKAAVAHLELVTGLKVKSMTKIVATSFTPEN